MATTCPDCGASGRFGTCDELFDVLLALDHGRRPPWGTFHLVSVACHLLQHPSDPRARDAAQLVALLREFRRGGIDAVHHRARARVAANRRGRLPPAGPSTVARVRRPDRTIEDLSWDGSFPADGFECRIEGWVEATLSMLDEP